MVHFSKIYEIVQPRCSKVNTRQEGKKRASVISEGRSMDEVWG
jgi:hypothetical protein